MKKKMLLVLMFIFLTLMASQWSMIHYAWMQARGQLKIIFNTVPLEQIVSDPNYPDSLKAKLRVIEKARNYAINVLDLNASENYTTYYDQDGKVSLWNLSASEAYQLKPYTWHFPFLGSFPYKGFFELEKAREEKKRLDELGYDTRIRSVGGWSTLGWTRDPILSNMLSRSVGRLSELIIHELTHSTIFVKDHVEFNENLASFIGEEGARLFLKDTYGVHSPEYQEYILNEEDNKNLVKHIIRGARKLDSVYQSIQNYPDSVKEAYKSSFISRITRATDTIRFHDKQYYDFYRNKLPNNAYFMTFLRYHSSEDSLKILLTTVYDNDLKAFVRGMIDFHNH